MRTLFNKKNKFYTVVLLICILLQISFSFITTDPQWIEKYYSRGFYPVFSYVSIVLFAWIPFSVGDILYGIFVILLLTLLFKITRALFKKKWSIVLHKLLQTAALLLFMYTYFYINWGLNYFRIPVVKQIGLDLEKSTKEDYLTVLEKYIHEANLLRSKLDLESRQKLGVRKDLEEFVRKDTLFKDLRSTSQLHGKEPLSSNVVSYFTVSGYFNPFTLEVQVNQNIPLPSYPFVNVHELAHQMGIGFEDECNFIAFRTLIRHKDDWYRYSAYYEAIQYLLYPLYKEEDLYKKYTALLSKDVKSDLNKERLFWQDYTSWFNKISGLFYNQYLKHNNQPEGMERYGMMARLVVAWEKKQKEL